MFVLTSFGLMVAAGPGWAAQPDRVGWWTESTQTSPADVSAPSGADVPHGGMLVQSAADSSTPVAIGALSFDLPEGATVGKLVLKVAGTSGTIPNSSLALCPLDDPSFTPVDGGALSDAPHYSCTHEIVAAPSSDGTSYTFNAAPLLVDGRVAVAVVPASAPARVVLAPPDSGSLAVTESAPAAAPQEPTGAQIPAAVAPAPADPATVPLQAASGPAALPQGTGTVQAPELAPSSASAAPAATTLAQSVRQAATTGNGGTHLGSLLALFLLASLLVTWGAASASARRPLAATPVASAEE